VVVNHDSGALVWAMAGRDKKTLRGFFEALGDERCAKIKLVSADGAEWISDVVAKRCKNAVHCMDPFHVVQGCTDALDEVRRDVWNAARKGGMKGLAGDFKGARYGLWKNPEVRHEAPPQPGGDERTPPPVCRSRPVKLRAA